MKTYKSTIRKIRLKEEKTSYKKVQVKSSKDAYQAMKPLFEDSMTLYESFYILFLNQSCNTTGFVKISQGGIAGTVVDKRLVAKYCVETLSPSIIIAHNHPSGSTKPSDQDKRITRELIQALSLFDCKILDHLILTDDNYFSFADEGLI